MRGEINKYLCLRKLKSFYLSINAWPNNAVIYNVKMLNNHFSCMLFTFGGKKEQFSFVYASNLNIEY